MVNIQFKVVMIKLVTTSLKLKSVVLTSITPFIVSIKDHILGSNDLCKRKSYRRNSSKIYRGEPAKNSFEDPIKACRYCVCCSFITPPLTRRVSP